MDSPLSHSSAPSTSQPSSSSAGFTYDWSNSPYKRQFTYQRVPSNEWVGRYPPAEPPNDVINIKEEERWLKEVAFKKSYSYNPLFDETGKVDLPADTKGILVLCPESRTRIIDVDLERIALIDYSNWLHHAGTEEQTHGSVLNFRWITGLNEEVNEDFNCVREEYRLVVDEERRKHGLTDLATMAAWRVRYECAGGTCWTDQDDMETIKQVMDCQAQDGLQPANSSPSELNRAGSHTWDHESSHSATQDSSISPTPVDTTPSLSSISSYPVSSRPTTPALDLVTLWW